MMVWRRDAPLDRTSRSCPPDSGGHAERPRMEHRPWYLLLAGMVLGTCIVAESSAVVKPDISAPSPASAPASAPVRTSNFKLPVLQPSQSVPPIGTFTLKDVNQNICLKMTMGVEYVVMVKKKPFYFNLDPKSVQVGGYCTTDQAVLSLGFPDNAGSLVLTFTKEGSVSYVSGLTAHITPEPCKGCLKKDYPGVLANEKLFLTPSGRSFKCKSPRYFVMAEELSLKMEPLQVQAFTIPKNGTFGQVVECREDFNKRVIYMIIGAVMVGFLLIAGVSYLVIRDHRRQGYERLGS